MRKGTETLDLKEISRNRHDQYHRGLVSILIRFSITCVTIILLIICLFSFSRIGDLDKWHQRGFNALPILLTGTMSICIGSLLGYLGLMIRWPILAGATHTAQDIDYILEMGSPTGALRLIVKNVSQSRWTRTTSIVAMFFFVNIAGRLSVALFGLTFNLTDVPGVDYPIMVTNWSVDPTNPSPHWIAFPGNNYSEELYIDGNNSLPIGISTWTQLVNFTSFNDTLEGTDPDHVLELDYYIDNMKSEVDKDTTKYSYALKERQYFNVTPSTNVIHSSATCKTLFLDGNR
ncbi:hypothetical protein K440DRAFT_537548, partial [Wilcoxina mikolae CBS 423.85]